VVARQRFESTSRWRRRSRPIFHAANPRTGRLVIGHAGRIAGGGLVLACAANE